MKNGAALLKNNNKYAHMTQAAHVLGEAKLASTVLNSKFQLVPLLSECFGFSMPPLRMLT